MPAAGGLNGKVELLTDQSSRRTLTPGDKNNLIAPMRGLVRTASDARAAEPLELRPLQHRVEPVVVAAGARQLLDTLRGGGN